MNFKFKFINAEVTRIKLYRDEMDRLLKAIDCYEKHHPTNSWTRDMSLRLLKQEWSTIDVQKN